MLKKNGILFSVVCLFSMGSIVSRVNLKLRPVIIRTRPEFHPGVVQNNSPVQRMVLPLAFLPALNRVNRIAPVQQINQEVELPPLVLPAQINGGGAPVVRHVSFY